MLLKVGMARVARSVRAEAEGPRRGEALAPRVTINIVPGTSPCPKTARRIGYRREGLDP